MNMGAFRGPADEDSRGRPQFSHRHGLFIGRSNAFSIQGLVKGEWEDGVVGSEGGHGRSENRTSSLENRRATFHPYGVGK